MITALRWSDARVHNGRSVRYLGFQLRSTLPLQAVCLLGGGVCEQMKRLLAKEFESDVMEPIIPDSSARAVLFDGALTYRVRGHICDVFIVLRPLDAHRLVGAAFGETERPQNASLSEVEKTTLKRMVMALAPLCVPLCGRVGTVTLEETRRARAESVTYFETRLALTPPIAVGFALTSDPPEETAESLRIEDLLDVELGGSVEFARGEIMFSALASLEPESIVPLRTGLEENGVLRFGAVPFAHGACGVKNERACFVVGGS